MRLLSIFVLPVTFQPTVSFIPQRDLLYLCTSAALHLTFIALLPTKLFLKPKKSICVRLGNLLENLSQTLKQIM